MIERKLLIPILTGLSAIAFDGSGERISSDGTINENRGEGGNYLFLLPGYEGEVH